MRVAVISAVYNEEKTIAHLIESLLHQTHLPDEIIFVDDGSTDQTGKMIQDYAAKNPAIKYLYQENKGPATARNLAWRKAHAEICIFTDGDCVPEADWIEKMLPPFEDETVGGTAGTYKTLNPKSYLARFIGLEIAWRYRDIHDTVNAHGCYSLAVRKKVLEEVDGFCEDYPKPSGEDFDLTYKIAKKYKIIFVPAAVVGHYHPESFSWYISNQTRRAYDRMRVYRDHPDKSNADSYTGHLTKYQVVGAGILLILTMLSTFWPGFEKLARLSLIVLFASCFNEFSFLMRHDKTIALISPFIIFFRLFCWFFGALAGFVQFHIFKKPS